MDENENDVWTFSDVLNDVILDCEAAASTAKPGSEEHMVVTKELISLCETKARCVETDLKIETEKSKLELDKRSLDLKERELDLKEREISLAEYDQKINTTHRWVEKGQRALETLGFLGMGLLVLKAECEDNRYMKTSAWRLISSGISKGLLRPPM